MFKFKQISPKKKIFLLGFILIMAPGVIIAYLSLESINQKEENLKVNYKGTVGLVRDKMESEVFKKETILKNSAIELFFTPVNKTDSQSLLQKLASENLAFDQLFLVNSNGGIISSSISIGWDTIPESQPLLSQLITTDFSMAEKAEYIRKDFVEAIAHYQRALGSTKFVKDQALLLSRIGRCYYKYGEYNTGIKEYKKMLELEGGDMTIGNIPVSIIALSQISHGYASLKDEKEHANNQFELYKKLLDHPWDLLGGEYQYYLKSARVEINKIEVSSIEKNAVQIKMKEFIIKENRLLKEIRFMEYIIQDILPNIEAELRNGGLIEIPSLDILQNGNKPTSQIGFFKLPASYQQSESLVMGYRFEKDYILSNLFPEILSTVELGKNVLVGVLNEKDSLLYIQQNSSLSNYLVIDQFSQLFVNWKVGLFDKDGKSIEQLVGKERRLYLILFLGIIFVMIIGFVILVRAVYSVSKK